MKDGHETVHDRYEKSVQLMTRIHFAHRLDWGFITACIVDSLVDPVVPELFVSGMAVAQFIKKTYDHQMQQADQAHACCLCGWFSDQKMKQCACRKKVRYCSKRCQLLHWRLGHKDECSEAAKL